MVRFQFKTFDEWFEEHGKNSAKELCNHVGAKRLMQLVWEASRERKKKGQGKPVNFPAPTAMHIVQVKLASGDWVNVCRSNAELLQKLAHVKVEFKPFHHARRFWHLMDESYVYEPRMLFRARNK